LKEYIQNVEAGIPDECFEFLIPGLIHLYDSDNPMVRDDSIDAFSALITPMDQALKLEQVVRIKRAAKSLFDSKRNAKDELVSGLCIPKGWVPILGVLREGILCSTVEIKEAAGVATAQLVQMSNANGLKPHVVNMAGPLIRVLGERHPTPVKMAALNTLQKLLDKLPVDLKPFLPQMQSVFLKVFSDQTSQNLRLSASTCISRLLDIHPKPEILYKELSKLNEEDGYKDDPLFNELLTSALQKMS